MRTRCQAREEVKPSPSAGEHAKAKSGSVLHLLLSITFFLETLDFRRRVLLGLFQNRITRNRRFPCSFASYSVFGMNGISFLHSAPDSWMNRMNGIRFTRNRQNTLGARGLSCAVSGLGQCLYCDPHEKPLEKSAVSLIAPSQWETCSNQFSPAFGLDSRLAPIDLPRVLCCNRLFDWFQE